MMWIGRIGVIIIAVIAAVLHAIRDLYVGRFLRMGGLRQRFRSDRATCAVLETDDGEDRIAGMATGFVISILWNQLWAGPTGLYEIVPGFLLALAVCVIVSLLDKNLLPISKRNSRKQK